MLSVGWGQWNRCLTGAKKWVFFCSTSTMKWMSFCLTRTTKWMPSTQAMASCRSGQTLPRHAWMQASTLWDPHPRWCTGWATRLRRGSLPSTLVSDLDYHGSDVTGILTITTVRHIYISIIIVILLQQSDRIGITTIFISVGHWSSQRVATASSSSSSSSSLG